jgi:hypothetical protein
LKGEERRNDMDRMAGLSLLSAIGSRAERKSPLYAYRVTDQEFASLRDYLRAELHRINSVRGSLAAMFCLYAAEQLCRGYRGGPWAWKLVLDPLHWTPTPSQRSAAVQAGLEYWQRPVVSVRTQERMLSTLVCEGGLPLHLLADDRDRHIKLFFRSLIQRAEKFGGSASRFVDDQLTLLPSSFRNETVAELASMLADEVVKLRQLLPPELAEDPLEYLARSVPNWAVSVPIRVTNEAFTELLRGLLTQPRERLQAELPVELATILHRTPPGRIERRATFSKIASVGSMAQLFGVEPTVISSHARLSLSLVASDGERYPVAVARLHQDQKSFRIESLPPSPIRDDLVVGERVLIAATVGGQEVGCTEVPGGQPLLPDVPWVFEGGERPECELLAQGSFRTSSTEVLIGIPSTLTLDLTAGESHDTSLRIRDREVRAVSGRTVVRGDGEEWMISTGVERQQDEIYVLVGRLDRAGFLGSEFWRGFPAVHLVKESGSRTAVPQTQIEVRPLGTGTWKSCGSATGELDVRIRNEGRTVFRTRIMTLPPATKLQLNANDLTVEIVASDLMEARLASGPPTEATSGRCRLKLPDGCADATVALNLTFRDGWATLMIPSPMRKAEFVGRNGATNGPLAIDRAGQIRARAVTPNPSEQFDLEARAKGTSAWMRITRLCSPGSSPGVWEVSLESVRAQLADFFASTEDLDAKVELRLLSTVGGRASQTFTLRRYETLSRPLWKDDYVEFELESDADASVGSAGLDLIELRLRPFLEPDQPPKPIPRSANRWRIDAPELAKAPAWLVTGHVGERVRLRPLLVTSRNFEQGTVRTELEQSMLEPRPRERRKRLEGLLKTMARSWNNPDWEQLARFLGTFESLPATTFDVIGVLGHIPEAAASALFRCGGGAEAFVKTWRGMQDLPFLWEAVPISAWELAADSLERWTTECAAGDLKVRRALTELFTDLLPQSARQATPFLDVLHDLFSRTIAYVRQPAAPYLGMPASALHDQLIAEVKAALLRHDGEDWPTNLEPLRTNVRSWGAVGRSGDERDDALDVDLDVELEAPFAAELRRGGVFRRFGDARYRRALWMPFFVGLAAGLDEQLDPRSILSVRRIRTFDAEWFEVAHAIGFAVGARQWIKRRDT